MPPSLEELLVPPDELEELVVQEVGQSALFGARFRENAARALLIPRRRPGQRTPLWQQRLKAQGLLQVARRYGSFPIVLETYRECLQDVFDLPALKRILHGLQTRELDLVEVETPSASPFASSLLFDYVATYMYEDDTPPAERRAQALSLDRDLLRELLGQDELRELIDPGALEPVESELRGAPRNATSCTTSCAGAAHLFPAEYDVGFAETLLRERRALRFRLAGERGADRVEDAGRYRDGLGVMPPGGLPEAYLEGGPDSLRQLVARYARGRGPVHDRGGERAIRRRRRGRAARARARGPARPRRAAAPAAASASGATPTCCGGCGAPRSPRSAARSSPPSRQRSAASCPRWHGIDRRATLREALVPLQGLALPVSLWESEVLPRRVPGYRSEWLDAL